MSKVVNYLLSTWQMFTGKMSDIVVENNYMINVVCWLFLVIFCVFLVAWFELWFVTGKPDLQILLQAVDRVTAPATLAAVKYISETYSKTKIEQAKIQFIDKNNNGVDDRVEGDVKQ